MPAEPGQVGPSRSPRRREDRKVRVWAELGFTISLDPDRELTIRPLVGHERWVSTDSIKALEAGMVAADELNHQVISGIIKRSARLAREAMRQSAEEDLPPGERAARRVRRGRPSGR